MMSKNQCLRLWGRVARVSPPAMGGSSTRRPFVAIASHIIKDTSPVAARTSRRLLSLPKTIMSTPSRNMSSASHGDSFDDTSHLVEQKTSFTLYTDHTCVVFRGRAPVLNQSGFVKNAGAITLGFYLRNNNSDSDQQWNWKQGRYFQLSVTEVGSVTALERYGGSVSMKHHYGKENSSGVEQEVKKILELTTQQNGYNMSYVEGDTKIDVPISIGEFEVVRELLRSSIPNLLNWEIPRAQFFKDSYDDQWSRD